MPVRADEPQGPLSTTGLPPFIGARLTVEQANRNCAALGREKLVRELQFRNAGLGDDAVDNLEPEDIEFKENFAAPIREYPGLPELAKACIDHLIQHKCDFGTAFSLFRLGEHDQWKQKDIWDLDKYNPTLCNRNGQPQGHYLQEDSTGSTFIKDPLHVLPRRIWDLRSHRVIPFEWYPYTAINNSDPIYGPFENVGGRMSGIVAISHSWTNDMEGVTTPVNRNEWPVPLPSGVTLERLRDQLWEQGARYCWLDVLCLRQTSNDAYKESLRAEEWKIDVPTIGNVYRHAEKLVRYFNGLGRPFQPSGWESDRHWLNRAWTLQEMIPEEDTVTGGAIGDQDPLDSQIGDGHETLREVIDNLARRIGRNEDVAFPPNILRLVQEMKRRCATKDLDRIGGIMYLLLTGEHRQTLPIYDENSSSETAWKRAIGTIVQASMIPLPDGEVSQGVEDNFNEDDAAAWSLFTQFPYPSAGHWFPSWNQVINFPEKVLREDQIDPGTSYSNTHLRLDGTVFYRYRNCHLVSTGNGVDQRTLVYGNSGSKELKDRLFISGSGATIENGQYLVVCSYYGYDDGDGTLTSEDGNGWNARNLVNLVICREISEVEGDNGNNTIRARKVGLLAIPSTKVELMLDTEEFDLIDDDIEVIIE